MAGPAAAGKISEVEIGDTLGFLLGRWELERAFEDDRAGGDGIFSGTATVAVPAGSGHARWDERGTVHVGTLDGDAERHLLLVDRPGSLVEVLFADGRPYVDLDLASGSWHAVHLCGDDRYEITTTVRTDDELEERWAVTGPSKAYRARTVLRRSHT